MNDGPDFIEIQRKWDEGDMTIDQAKRCGSTHAAYGWASQPPQNWSQELQDAYMIGFRSYKGERG